MTIYTLTNRLTPHLQRTSPSAGAIDVREDGEGYTVHMVVPGIAPEQIEVTVVGRTLTIQAEQADAAEQTESRQHLREFVVGRVARRIEFPLAVDGDGVVAQSAHGILTVRVPKSAAAQPKRIAVTTSMASDA